MHFFLNYLKSKKFSKTVQKKEVIFSESNLRGNIFTMREIPPDLYSKTTIFSLAIAKKGIADEFRTPVFSEYFFIL